MHRFRTGWYSIPYDSSNKAAYGSNGVHQGLLTDSDLFTKSLTRAMEQDALDIDNFFKERFEIDLENEHYEKIDVPDFRGGRQGRFIHDFNIVSQYCGSLVSSARSLILYLRGLCNPRLWEGCKLISQILPLTSSELILVSL